jgi:hypothetical protein
MKSLLLCLVVGALALGAASAGAAPSPQYDVGPPGWIVQDTPANLTGSQSPWHVVTSRKLAGKQMGKEPVYQWYLSFYAPVQNGFKLVYQLPNKDGELLSRVTKAPGAQMYFPHQDVRIIGTGEFEQPGLQDVVVWDHQSAADCGIADVTVFGADGDKVQQRVHVENACKLQAKIVHNHKRASIQLSGPYYGSNAPLCCPKKPSATAMLSYAGGTWGEAPNYFIISASLAAHR